MDFENDDSLKNQTESEEDDFGCYFLQPSSMPYNITEKVQQANVDLFTSHSNLLNAEKIVKVKFREELISFEPEDLTDDDVNSIESDHTELSIEPRSPISECKTLIGNQNLVMSNIEEELQEDEVLEEIGSDNEYEPEIKVNTNRSSDEIINYEEKSALSSNRKRTSTRKKSAKSKTAFLNPHEVNCKDHCIDKLDNDLSMSIRRLFIQEKPAPPSVPPLPLLQRKCCDEVKNKIQQNLPNYHGLRSEYGLSSRQLEKRKKQRESFKAREHMRRQLLDEYRQRKIQQNEEVFCQWLKEVSKRKSEKISKKRATSGKEARGSTTSVVAHKISQRPKSTNGFLTNTKTRKIKRRPQSSNARVFIQVPKSCLENHLRIGNLIISNSKLYSKNIEIITIS